MGALWAISRFTCSKRKRSSLRGTVRGWRRLTLTFVSQDTSGVPCHARAGERSTLYTRQGAEGGDCGPRELSLRWLWWMAFVYQHRVCSSICNPHWTSQCRALLLHVETSTLSAVLPSPPGIPTRDFSRFLLLNERSLNFGSKSLFKFYHLETAPMMSYCAVPAIVPYSGSVPL